MFDLGKDVRHVVAYRPSSEERMREYAAPVAWGALHRAPRGSILRGLKRLPGGDMLSALLDTPAKIERYAGMNFDRLPQSLQRKLIERIGPDGGFKVESYLVVQTPSTS